MAHILRAETPGVAPSEGGSFVTVTVTVRARMCDVGGSFPRVRVGCCHQHVRMRMRCSTLFSLLPLLLSFPPSLAPPARPRYTWRPHAAATDHNAFIIIPCFCFPLLPSSIVDTNLAREYPRGVTHTTQSFLWWGGMLEVLFPQDLVQLYRVVSSVPFPVSVHIECRWEGVNHLQ